MRLLSDVKVVDRYEAVNQVSRNSRSSHVVVVM